MSIIKRISRTVFASIDQVVGEIENHEAIIQASLKEMRQKVAKAKLQLGQVRREETKLKQQLQAQQQQVELWRQRAIACGQDDEAKALECLRRSKLCQQQQERLVEAIEQYQEHSQKLSKDIQVSEQHMSQTMQKYQLMRARQSTSSALNAANMTESDTTQLLDDAFDRWEINVSESEMAVESYDLLDPVEQAFVASEQQEALRQELKQLLDKEVAK